MGNLGGGVETKCSGSLHYIEVILMWKPSDGDYEVSTAHPSQAVAKTLFFTFEHTFWNLSCLLCYLQSLQIEFRSF